jgi:hypothetical protein
VSGVPAACFVADSDTISWLNYGDFEAFTGQAAAQTVVLVTAQVLRQKTYT